MTRQAPPLRVIVVEDDDRYRDSLISLFKLSSGLTLAGSYGSALDALAALAAERNAGRDPGWNLVLMDLDLPGLDGVGATRRLKSLAPEILIVVLTVFEEPATILKAICSGADGYLLKRTPPAELLEQLQVVVDGGAPLTAGVASTVLKLLRTPGGSPGSAPVGAAVGLSHRERDVLGALVDGLAYKQVADKLGISIDTVRTHVRGLYKKLQVHSVAEAVGRALRDRIV